MTCVMKNINVDIVLMEMFCKTLMNFGDVHDIIRPKRGSLIGTNVFTY